MSTPKRPVPKHPVQPVILDESGVARFKHNSMVNFLLNTSKFTLNDMAYMDFPKEDWEQFAQLTGYSVGGFSDLSYASDEVVQNAMEQVQYLDTLADIKDENRIDKEFE